MKLTVTESLLLFCLDDQTGKFRAMPDRALDHAVAGAILAELQHRQLIRREESDIVVLADAQTPSEKELAEALKLLRERRRCSLRDATIQLAAEARGLISAVLDRLVAREILRKDEEEFLWIFHSERYETLDLSEELAVRDRIRRAVLEASTEPSREETVLIALMDVCQLGPLMFSHGELERAQERIRSLASHDSIGCAVRETLNEIQRAMLEIRTYSGM